MEINSNTGSMRDMALARASANQEARNNERVSNRKEINRNSSEVAFLNQTNRATRATAVTKAGLSTTLGAFNSATNAVDTIKSNLQEIRSIIDTGIKGTLANTDAGQNRINELVAAIKSLTENTKYGDQKIFGGSFSYKTLLDSNNTIYSKNLSNTETGIVEPPAPPVTPSTVSEVVNINQNSQERTNGYRWQNSTLSGTGFSAGASGQQTSITVNNQYIVKNEEDISGYTMNVYDKNTGTEIRSYSNSQNYQASAMALNNDNQLVQAKLEGLFLDDLDTAAQDNLELKDSNNQTITGITSLDISDNYIVATKAAASGNGGKAYIFNASTGALMDEVTDTASEPNSKFGSDIAIDGNTLIIGAKYTSAAAEAAGKKGGYVKTYDISSGLAVEQSRIDVLSSNFGDSGFASKLDFQGNTLIINAGSKSLVYDVSAGNAVKKGTIDQGQQVEDYQIEGDKVLIQDSTNTTKIYDLKNFQDVNSLYVTNGSDHSVGSKTAVAFDGTNIFSQNATKSSSNISKSTLVNVSNNISDSDAMGKQVASTDNYIISLAPGRDNNGVRNSGSLFVYDKLSGSLVKEFKDIAAQPNNSSLDNFSIAASGNKIAILDKAGNQATVYNISSSAATTFAVGAEDDTIAIGGSNIAVGSSAVNASDYNTINVYNQNGLGAISLLRQLQSTAGGTGGSFGDSIDISGDTLVAANSAKGRLEVFDLVSGSSTASIALTGRSSSLKSQVSISGGNIAVSNINDARAVGLYNVNLVNQKTFTGGASAATNQFGESIDLSGDYLAIGASNEQNPITGGGKGAVHLYDISTNSKISTIFSNADLGSDTSRFGSSVSISGTRLVVGAPNGTGAPGENGGNISLFNISVAGSYTDYPFARPKSLIQGTRGIEIDVTSNKKGTFATGTYNALQDISVSSTVASLGGKQDLANFKDLYDIDQMLANLSSISGFIKDETKMLNRYAPANQGYYNYNKRQFDRLNANKVSVQANSNPAQVANLLP